MQKETQVKQEKLDKNKPKKLDDIFDKPSLGVKKPVTQKPKNTDNNKNPVKGGKKGPPVFTNPSKQYGDKDKEKHSTTHPQQTQQKQHLKEPPKFSGTIGTKIEPKTTTDKEKPIEAKIEENIEKPKFSHGGDQTEGHLVEINQKEDVSNLKCYICIYTYIQSYTYIHIYTYNNIILN